MRVLTLVVICQRLDYAAIAYAAMTAFIHHSLQLCAESNQLADAPVNFSHVTAGDAIGFRTWLFRPRAHRQQFPDGIDFESQLSRMPDKNQSRHFGTTITALLAVAA